jgi:hypothetical protein
MCDNCRQLENDIKRFRKLFERSFDPLTIKLQRSRKLLAIGLDPLTIERIEETIQELVQHKPAYALTANRSPLGTGTGFPLGSGRKAAGS